MSRELVLTVTIHDCEVQTFRSGGKGGQNQNKRDTGVRIIHHPSGARGESREERSQLQNKKAAFRRMAESPKMKYWLAVQTHAVQSDAEYLRVQMAPEKLRTEVRGPDHKWMVLDEIADLPE